MELDHLKDLWNKEQIMETPEISTEKQKEIHLPLEKIRRNMRKEFWSTAVFFLFIILFFIFVDMHFFRFKIYVIALVTAMMLITGFYFFKFFQLYKNITDVNFNTKDSLNELIHQFRLNEQYYLSFYIAFVPFVFCEMFLIFDYSPNLKALSGIKFILLLGATTLTTLVILFSVGKWWFARNYGKYINQIVKTRQDLR